MNAIGYHPGDSIHNNVLSFLERKTERNPDQALFRWATPQHLAAWSGAQDCSLPHESLAFGPFLQGVRRLGAAFLELGLRPGDRALLFLPMSAEMYGAMSALQWIGAVPVFMDSWARRGQLGVAARIAAPRAMISFAGAFQAASGVPELDAVPLKISLGPTPTSCTARLEELASGTRQAPLAPVAQEDTALITFTTGSSGEPKGANRTHRFLAAQHYALETCIPYGDDEVDLPIFPIFALNNIASGVTTVLPAIDAGVPAERDAALLRVQLQSCEVTTTTLSPYLFNALSQYCLGRGEALPSLRRALTGGAPVSRTDLRDFAAIAPRAEILVLYGSTEVEPIAHIDARQLLDSPPANSDPEWAEEGVNVGRLHPALTCRFIQIRQEPIAAPSPEAWSALEVPRGVPGELVVAGEHVCGGYFNNPEAFRRAKICAPDGTVFHRTGDLGYLDDRDCLWIVGRLHNAICRGGVWLFPVRAELLLRRLPFVRQAAYLGMPDPLLGERCVCVVVTHDQDRTAPESWRRDIERAMARNGMPVDHLVFRDRIPMDPRHHSKVEYELLRGELQAEQVR